ncbi:MAG: hypothetical protein WD512_20295, partial [Candidatus Paceibacterota bacterium]
MKTVNKIIEDLKFINHQESRTLPLGYAIGYDTALDDVKSALDNAEVEKLLSFISSDYQFDPLNDKYMGMININPQTTWVEYKNAYDLLIKDSSRFDDLLSKYSLKVNRANEEEIIFVSDTTVEVTNYEDYDYVVFITRSSGKFLGFNFHYGSGAICISFSDIDPQLTKAFN